MLLSELRPGSQIEVGFYAGGNYASFYLGVHSALLRPETLEVLKERYHNDFAVVSAPGEYAQLLTTSPVFMRATATCNNKEILWKKTRLVATRDAEGKVCFVLVAHQQAESINRRDAFRVFVQVPARYKKKEMNISPAVLRPHTCQVQNVSSNGFGITAKASEEIKPGDVLYLEFLDPAMDAEFELEGEVVRTNINIKGELFLGCKLLKSSKLLDRYVAAKQTKMLTKENR